MKFGVSRIKNRGEKMKIRLLLLSLSLFVMSEVLMFSPAISSTITAQNAAEKSVKQDKDDKKKKKKQKRQEIELKAAKGISTGKGAVDPNIKEDDAPNVPNAPKNPPVAKGGGTSKGIGGDCEVQFDNQTNLNIKTFINGRYRGTVGEYGDSNLYIVPGYISVYARADFSDGTYLYWGPEKQNCEGNQYIYFKLTQQDR